MFNWKERRGDDVEGGSFEVGVAIKLGGWEHERAIKCAVTLSGF